MYKKKVKEKRLALPKDCELSSWHRRRMVRDYRFIIDNNYSVPAKYIGYNIYVLSLERKVYYKRYCYGIIKGIIGSKKIYSDKITDSACQKALYFLICLHPTIKIILKNDCYNLTLADDTEDYKKQNWQDTGNNHVICSRYKKLNADFNRSDRIKTNTNKKSIIFDDKEKIVVLNESNLTPDVGQYNSDIKDDGALLNLVNEANIELNNFIGKEKTQIQSSLIIDALLSDGSYNSKNKINVFSINKQKIEQGQLRSLNMNMELEQTNFIIYFYFSFASYRSSYYYLINNIRNEPQGWQKKQSKLVIWQDTKKRMKWINNIFYDEINNLNNYCKYKINSGFYISQTSWFSISPPQVQLAKDYSTVFASITRESTWLNVVLNTAKNYTAQSKLDSRIPLAFQINQESKYIITYELRYYQSCQQHYEIYYQLLQGNLLGQKLNHSLVQSNDWLASLYGKQKSYNYYPQPLLQPMNPQNYGYPWGGQSRQLEFFYLKTVLQSPKDKQIMVYKAILEHKQNTFSFILKDVIKHQHLITLFNLGGYGQNYLAGQQSLWYWNELEDLDDVQLNNQADQGEEEKSEVEDSIMKDGKSDSQNDLNYYYLVILMSMGFEWLNIFFKKDYLKKCQQSSSTYQILKIMPIQYSDVVAKKSQIQKVPNIKIFKLNGQSIIITPESPVFKVTHDQELFDYLSTLHSETILGFAQLHNYLSQRYIKDTIKELIIIQSYSNERLAISYKHYDKIVPSSSIKNNETNKTSQTILSKQKVTHYIIQQNNIKVTESNKNRGYCYYWLNSKDIKKIIAFLENSYHFIEGKIILIFNQQTNGPIYPDNICQLEDGALSARILIIKKRNFFELIKPHYQLNDYPCAKKLSPILCFNKKKSEDYVYKEVCVKIFDNDYLKIKGFKALEISGEPLAKNDHSLDEFQIQVEKRRKKLINLNNVERIKQYEISGEAKFNNSLRLKSIYDLIISEARNRLSDKFDQLENNYEFLYLAKDMQIFLSLDKFSSLNNKQLAQYIRQGLEQRIGKSNACKLQKIYRNISGKDQELHIGNPNKNGYDKRKFYWQFGIHQDFDNSKSKSYDEIKLGCYGAIKYCCEQRTEFTYNSGITDFGVDITETIAEIKPFIEDGQYNYGSAEISIETKINLQFKFISAFTPASMLTGLYDDHMKLILALPSVSSFYFNKPSNSPEITEVIPLIFTIFSETWQLRLLMEKIETINQSFNEWCIEKKDLHRAVNFGVDYAISYSILMQFIGTQNLYLNHNGVILVGNLAHAVLYQLEGHKQLVSDHVFNIKLTYFSTLLKNYFFNSLASYATGHYPSSLGYIKKASIVILTGLIIDESPKIVLQATREIYQGTLDLIKNANNYFAEKIYHQSNEIDQQCETYEFNSDFLSQSNGITMTDNYTSLSLYKEHEIIFDSELLNNESIIKFI